ncbi:MAG: DUF115 domain-containing protein [Deltaproteobacteria bacterium]|nr:DUF115 domain-containing protein [Deltaproteobacteria bacterium]
MGTLKPYDREKRTLIAQEWEPTDEDLFIHRPHETEAPDSTLLEKLPEWLQNWRVNHETIGFDRTVEDLPRIRGPALVVDNPMSGGLDRHLEALKRFRGTILSCDRAAWKLCMHGIVPDVLCNVDSSFLCVPFVDNTEVRRHMDRISGVFASTVNPLTVRAFSGKRYWFQPWQNSYNKYGETEYPGVRHRVVENKYGRFYTDPVYEAYNEILLKYARFARERHGVRTVNCNRGGICYGEGVEDLSLEEFVEGFG